MVFFEIKIKTTKKQEVVEITEQVEEIIRETNIQEGLCCVFVLHATAAITLHENYDPQLGIDLINCLNKLIPENQWLHDQIDHNAAAHLKAAILGPSETLLVEKGKLVLGTWQSLVLCDFDGPKVRKIKVKLIENKKSEN